MNIGEEQVKASLERAIDTWGGSLSWEKLKVTLGRFNLASVNKIVAFALSSISEFSDEKDYDNRSAFQHALVVALQGLLSNLSHEHRQPKCYAQDPAYTEHDTNALQTLGITVLPDPEGFLEVDDETLVISVSPNVPVKQVVSDIARPAFIIWNTIAGDGLGVEPSTDPDSPRLQKWIAEHYETLEFPREPDLFGNVSMYVRRTLAGGGPVEQAAT
ncbi:hypothetical protein BJY01DRAFT_220354 [Aspergillus pseudoustus]|uniref:SRR1-like domain-containing protein n=1 Tax=Aspergillus pseudoustus TaxID=1810923 RepID=A0ABR4JD35_9EURO